MFNNFDHVIFVGYFTKKLYWNETRIKNCIVSNWEIDQKTHWKSNAQCHDNATIQILNDIEREGVKIIPHT